MDEQEDAFSKLFDTSPIDNQREALAAIILPFVRINPSTGEIGFTQDGDQLVTREKLLVYLLAQKAKFIRGLVSKEQTSPSEMERGTGLPGGTIRPILRRLVEDKLIRADKGDGGGYFIPNVKIREVGNVLMKGSSR
jgi:hypothetical protein